MTDPNQSSGQMHVLGTRTRDPPLHMDCQAMLAQFKAGEVSKTGRGAVETILQGDLFPSLRSPTKHVFREGRGEPFFWGGTAEGGKQKGQPALNSTRHTHTHM